MWSLADSSETITKRRNNDNNIGNHEKSKSRTWKLYCTLLNSGSNAIELLLGVTALNCAAPAVARCTHTIAGAASGTCLYIKSLWVLAARSISTFRTMFRENRRYLFPYVTLCSRDSAVGRATGHKLDNLGFDPLHREDFFLSSPKCPDRLSDLPSHTEWFSVACKVAGAWSWHVHLVPRLRIRGTSPLLHHRPPWRIQNNSTHGITKSERRGRCSDSDCGWTSEELQFDSS
jgi:hypothetical protein